jgi:carbohydrate-selective porin OprB
MGRYAAATSTGLAHRTIPDIVADDAPGRTKYGVTASGEFPLTPDGNSGVFARLGWSDGRNESFVFTEVDRHVSAGVQIDGASWHRLDDVFGIALAADGLSGPHRAYLAAGGRGFLLGDGALSYGPETLGEAYYRAQFGPHIALSPDLMLIVNPGYNRARGPATVFSVRVHAVK